MWRRERGSWSVAIPEATRSHEVLMVITGADVPVGNRSARPRRVDKAITSNVDPDVIDVSTVDTEKDEIAG
jgi:hypothetical protein